MPNLSNSVLFRIYSYFIKLVATCHICLRRIFLELYENIPLYDDNDNDMDERFYKLMFTQVCCTLEAEQFAVNVGGWVTDCVVTTTWLGRENNDCTNNS